MTDIEGELAEEPSTEVATRSESAGAVESFYPLDADPAGFARQLAARQDIYDQLQSHLRGVLVAGKDFGRIHVKKDCDNKYTCKNDYHFSGYMLFAPGADKILGILGLGVHYPDLKDYKRAVLQGTHLEEVIADCQILRLSGQVIAEGAGACARKEVNGSLNNTIKRACKRARLDAVLRLPVVSALFEADFLEQIAAAAATNGPNSSAKRTQKVRNAYDTGATLTICPIGNEIKGKPWHEIETEALQYLVDNVNDKPDVTRAASDELTKRIRADDPSSIRNSAPPAFEEGNQ